MKIFISVVNHNHDNIILAHNILATLASVFNVILKSNTKVTPELKLYCTQHNIHLIQGTSAKGFGANNNEVFDYARAELSMENHDYFLVLNPDVIIDSASIDNLLQLANQHNADISAINLYKNEEKTEYDNSIRHYHSLINPVKSLLGLPRLDMYDKSTIHQPIAIDWAAGSFLLFKAESYKKLNGFDEKYFMYFEDADICTRANKKGNTIMYFPQIEAVHLAQHNNRKLFSKHFVWYLRSCYRYHLLN